MKWINVATYSLILSVFATPTAQSAANDSYINSLPVSFVDYGTAVPGAAGQLSGAPFTPEGLYKLTCAACHQSGVLNAPKIGVKSDWAPRIAVGLDALAASAIKGKNAMPARGGSNASDAEIKATIEWMLAQ